MSLVSRIFADDPEDLKALEEALGLVEDPRERYLEVLRAVRVWGHSVQLVIDRTPSGGPWVAEAYRLGRLWVYRWRSLYVFPWMAPQASGRLDHPAQLVIMRLQPTVWALKDRSWTLDPVVYIRNRDGRPVLKPGTGKGGIQGMAVRPSESTWVSWTEFTSLGGEQNG